MFGRIQIIFAVFATILAVAATCEIHARPIQSSWPALSQSKYVFQIPSPIRGREIERYVQILDLSEPQSKFLEGAIIQYQEECRRSHDEQAPIMLAAAAPLNIRIKQWSIDPAYRDENNAICQREAEFFEGLRRIDDSFLSKIEQVLADEQRLRLPRVRLHRERARCHELIMTSVTIAKARTDLSRLLETAAFPDDVIAAMEETMWEYEQAITPLFVTVHRQCAADRVKSVDLRVQLQFDEHGDLRDATQNDVQQLQAELQRQLDGVREDAVSTMHAIGEVNDAFLPKFLDKLPPPFAKTYRTMYLTQCYKCVYPDPSDPEEVYSAVMQSELIEPDLRVVLERSWKDYRTTYDSICQNMRDEADRWQEWCALYWTTSGWQSSNELRHELWKQRAKANKDFMELFQSLLPDDVREEREAALQEWQRTLDRIEAAEQAMNPSRPSFE